MTKRKLVGILSMQRIINYGSFMQALGLKQLIESLGNEVVFVDYHIGNKFSKANIKNSQTYKKLRAALSFIKPQSTNLEAKAISSQYDILGLKGKYQYQTKVDTLVIGSDEVFNYIQEGGNVGYSPELIGVNNNASKVISYAASCGNLTKTRLKRFDKEKEFSKAMLSFDKISVRDFNTYELVADLTGIEPEMNLDPVLVSDFSELVQDNVSLSNYIIVYGYTNRFTEEEGRRILSYAMENGKKVYALGGKQVFCEDTITCKPLEVLAYFKHADLIITDTFHGTIFSIISEKNLVVIKRNGENGNENKLSFLIKQLGIEDKEISKLDDLETVIDRPIDFNKIQEYRTKERERSIEYLKNYL